jgi:hypothetical protein
MNRTHSPPSESATVPEDPGDPGQVLERWRSRVLGWGGSIAVHLLVFIALLWPQAALPPPPAPPPPIQVSLLETPKPPGPPDNSEASANSLPNAIQPKPPNAVMPVLVVLAPPRDTSDLLSDSQLAGAARAGEGGGGGGGCDIARALQVALRRDPLVRAAVENANRLGQATLLWNGDWVQSGGQDGKGLSAVREAIMWEVAFAPEACRHARMHGLVLLSLADGTTRFAVGSDDWRWSDLLFARKAGAAR